MDMNIQLSTANYLSPWIILLATFLVCIFGVFLTTSHNLFLFVIGYMTFLFGILVVPLALYSSAIGPNLPEEFSGKQKVFVNEDSLKKEAEEVYGYEMVNSRYVDGAYKFESMDGIVGTYLFKTEENKIITCGLQTNEPEKLGNRSKGDFAENEIKISAKLMCSPETETTLQEPEKVN